ncbi:MAG: 4-hydroxybenzoate polyprenyltransferase [Flavobacteriales bacterium]
MYLLRLIRLPNLLLIAFAQCIVRFGLIAPFEADITLSSLGFSFIVLATVLIAAGGYVINDVFDINADKINRPNKRVVGVHIKEKQAKLLYFILTFSGVGLGFVLSNMIGTPIYFLYFIITAFLLYAYARSLKRMGVVGNILVSLFVGLAIIIVGIFELIPAMTPSNNDDQMFVFYIIQQLAFFAFYMTLIRELVKDIQDIQGDHVARYKTLPILIGAARTAKITAFLVLILLTLVSWYVFTYLHDYKLVTAVILFGVVAPLGYVAIQLREATTSKNYKNISMLLKAIMFLGICTIPLISYMLQNAS